jgi:hypothetical protein
LSTVNFEIIFTILEMQSGRKYVLFLLCL